MARKKTLRIHGGDTCKKTSFKTDHRVGRLFFDLSWLVNLPTPSRTLLRNQGFIALRILRLKGNQPLLSPDHKAGGIWRAVGWPQPWSEKNLVSPRRPKTVILNLRKFVHYDFSRVGNKTTCYKVAPDILRHPKYLRILFEQDTIFGEGNQLFLRRFCLGGCR